MKYKQLIDKVAIDLGVDKKSIRIIANKLIKEICDNLISDEIMFIHKLGTLKIYKDNRYCKVYSTVVKPHKRIKFLMSYDMERRMRELSAKYLIEFENKNKIKEGVKDGSEISSVN